MKPRQMRRMNDNYGIKRRLYDDTASNSRNEQKDNVTTWQNERCSW